MGTVLLSFGLALATSGLFAFPVRRLALRLGVMDRPNERSSHHVPTPRAGGLAIVLGVVLTVPWLVPFDGELIWGALCVAAVAAVSLLDDLYGLSILTRLVVQAMAATGVVIGLGLPIRAADLPGAATDLSGWLGLVLAVLFTVAYCNFYNFMDGINGLAAGQAVLTAATVAILLQERDCGTGAVITAAACGASAGFLPHNFPVARVFMGDVGSVTLGFVLAVLSLAAHARAGVPWAAILLVHGVFLFDAGFTLLKRAWRGANLMRPHCEHNYQLLVRGGWRHVDAALALWSLSAGCCLAAYLYTRSGPWGRLAELMIIGILLAAFAVVAHRRGSALRREPVGGEPRGDRVVDGRLC